MKYIEVSFRCKVEDGFDREDFDILIDNIENVIWDLHEDIGHIDNWDLQDLKRGD